MCGVWLCVCVWCVWCVCVVWLSVNLTLCTPCQNGCLSCGAQLIWGFRLSTAENLWELRKKMEKGEVNYQSMTCANGHLRW